MNKTTKRIISFVMSCVLICSGLQSVTAEKTDKLEKAKNLLAALNIVSDDSDSIVTRERFADVYVRANNIYQEGYASENPFSDTYDSEYADSIHIMRDLGIVSGVGDNCYAPLDNMLTGDIAKLYVSALGFDVYVETSGKEYMQFAHDLDLFKGVGVSDYITMDNFILLTYNFLMAPVGEINFTQPPSYSFNENTNILYEKFGIRKITGQVIQNELSGLWSSASATEGYVVIKTNDGELTALEGKSGVASMLGHTLDIYMYDDQGEYEVVCYDKRANELCVTIDIGRVDFDETDNSRISYMKEGRTSISTEELSAFPAFIINGAYYDIGQFDIDTLRNYSGKISLISSGNSEYDIVIVEAYTNYYVKNVEYYDGEMRIYDSGSNPALVLDESAYKTMEIYYPNGASASPFEIQSGMLLTVAKSFGTQVYAKIFISDTTLEGSIVDCNYEDKLITMDDGIQYSVSPSYNMANIALRTQAKVYMDKFENVAWIEYDKTATFSYAFLRTARIDTDEDKVMVKVAVETGKFTKMHLAEKAIIDGKRYKTPDEQLAEIESVEKLANLAAGEYPFRYKLNDAGEIKEIDTPRIRSGYEEEDSFRATADGVSVICSNDKILGKEVPLSSNTVMFVVPEETAAEERENPAFYSVGNSSLLNTGGENTYTAFKVGNDSLYVDLVVRTQKGIGGGLNHDNVLFLVEDIRTAYDEKNEELRTKIYGLEAGVRKEYFLHKQFDQNKLAGIGRGDVLRFAFYADEITAVDKVFIYNDDTSTNTGKYYLPTGGQNASSLSQIGTSYYYSGYVMRREGRLIEILPFDLLASGQSSGVQVPNVPDWSLKKRRVFQAPTKISVYDPSLGARDSIYAGDLEDIPTYVDGRNYVKVIVRYRSRSAQEMIVLKDQSLFR